MKDYITNENGYILNPDISLKYKQNGVAIIVETIHYEDDTYASALRFRIDFGCCFGSSSSSIKNPDNYTLEDCIKHELGYAHKYLIHLIAEEEKGYYNWEGVLTVSKQNVSNLKKALNWVNSQLGPQQLTFDF